MIRVGIIGGTGYTGGELIRLLIMHPAAEITVVTSRSQKGKPVGALHPNLNRLIDLSFEDVDPAAIAKKCDVVFTAVPHGAAMAVVPGLVREGLRVIDLSADYRLPVAKFEEVYKRKHTGPLAAVYGLPELHTEVKDAKVVGNPGCYPTGANLALAPLVARGIVTHAVCDAKSGISGAGQEPTETSHYPNLAENVKPYAMTTHRHRCEIEQEQRRLDSHVEVYFTPHVVPSIRGILTTAHVFVNKPLAQDEVKGIYEEFYQGRPFVRLQAPSLAAVRGSNFCDIAWEVDQGTHRIVVASAIDNMVKGASGQAVQNMNLMFGLDERTGLWAGGLAP
ncbi:MAG TPA: N-acetyl-gamma-glutamyl-phosphate reductase [Methanocella sp.]|nr:N-acetyl-gamma-glutamyl-phosphate reductase [Methanocella sp.]